MIKLNLTKTINAIYSIENFDFTHDETLILEINDDKLEFMHEYEIIDLGIEEFENNYWNNAMREIEGNLIKSFHMLGIKAEIEKDTLLLHCDIDKLAEEIIEVINGYGMFYYNNVEEFFKLNNHTTNQGVIEEHLGWLTEFENVYQYNYGYFEFKPEMIESDYYFYNF